MTIAGRLKMNALLSSGVILIISLIFSLVLLVQNDARRKASLANELMRGTFELSFLGGSYLRYPDERPKEQWILKYNLLMSALEQMAPRDKREQVLVSRMHHNLSDLRALFDGLVGSYGKTSLRDPALSSDQNDLAAKYRRQLSNLMINRSHDVSLDASRLADANNREIEKTNQRIFITLPAAAVVLAVIALWLSLNMGRSIAGRISNLQAGAENVGSGNLDYRFTSSSDDELGGLSKALDRMTGSLKAITVSRDELQKEISERKRAERERESMFSELKRSNKELEQFAYVASHDLQEPLRMVASYVQLLEKRYRGQLDDKADTYIHFAVDGAKRMQKLIDGLLAYSRVARGAEFHSVELSDVFDHAVENLSTAIRESNAQVTRDDLPAVLGDDIQLMQLFQNLIGNALKFRSADKKPLIHAAARWTDTELVFSVTDNGIGIDPDYSARIFLLFYRLHRGDEYPGTGLGLAVCKRIVERHQGRIWVESTPGKGATFFFTIPAAPNKSERKAD